MASHQCIKKKIIGRKGRYDLLQKCYRLISKQNLKWSFWVYYWRMIFFNYFIIFMIISDLNLIFLLFIYLCQFSEVLFTSKDRVHLSDFERILKQTD